MEIDLNLLSETKTFLNSRFVNFSDLKLPPDYDYTIVLQWIENFLESRDCKYGMSEEDLKDKLTKLPIENWTIGEIKAKKCIINEEKRPNLQITRRLINKEDLSMESLFYEADFLHKDAPRAILIVMRTPDGELIPDEQEYHFCVLAINEGWKPAIFDLNRGAILFDYRIDARDDEMLSKNGKKRFLRGTWRDAWDTVLGHYLEHYTYEVRQIFDVNNQKIIPLKNNIADLTSLENIEIDLNETKISIKLSGKINILLGKVGSGKSQILQALYEKYQNECTYVPPERGSIIETPQEYQEINSQDTRRKNAFLHYANQNPSYRQDCLHKLSDYIKLTQASQEENDSILDEYDALVNKYLPYVRVKLRYYNDIKCFAIDIFDKESGIKIEPNKLKLSSGQSELISILIEIKLFFDRAKKDPLRKHILLLDEPDVHLHPDSQKDLMEILDDLKNSCHNVSIIIATHSATILSCFVKEAFVCFVNREKIKGKEQVELNFNRKIERYEELLPIFGAHPLTRVFNANPILLVEGQDDEWIWTLLVRKQVAKVYPCKMNGTGEIVYNCVRVNEILSAIYSDDAKAFLIRDRDDGTKFEQEERAIAEELGKYQISKDFIQKFLLNCYAIENFCFSDEFLEYWGVKWDELQKHIPYPKFKQAERGIKTNCKKEVAALMNYLYKNEDQKREKGIKDIKQMSWQEAVANVIASQIKHIRQHPAPYVIKQKHSILNYIGEGILCNLFKVKCHIQIEEEEESSELQKKKKKTAVGKKEGEQNDNSNAILKESLGKLNKHQQTACQTQLEESKATELHKKEKIVVSKQEDEIKESIEVIAKGPPEEGITLNETTCQTQFEENKSSDLHTKGKKGAVGKREEEQNKNSKSVNKESSEDIIKYQKPVCQTPPKEDKLLELMKKEKGVVFGKQEDELKESIEAIVKEPSEGIITHKEAKDQIQSKENKWLELQKEKIKLNENEEGQQQPYQ